MQIRGSKRGAGRAAHVERGCQGGISGRLDSRSQIDGSGQTHSVPAALDQREHRQRRHQTLPQRQPRRQPRTAHSLLQLAVKELRSSRSREIA